MPEPPGLPVRLMFQYQTEEAVLPVGRLQQLRQLVSDHALGELIKTLYCHLSIQCHAFSADSLTGVTERAMLGELTFS